MWCCSHEVDGQRWGVASKTQARACTAFCGPSVLPRCSHIPCVCVCACACVPVCWHSLPTGQKESYPPILSSPVGPNRTVGNGPHQRVRLYRTKRRLAGRGYTSDQFAQLTSSELNGRTETFRNLAPSIPLLSIIMTFSDRDLMLDAAPYRKPGCLPAGGANISPCLLVGQMRLSGCLEPSCRELDWGPQCYLPSRAPGGRWIMTGARRDMRWKPSRFPMLACILGDG